MDEWLGVGGNIPSPKTWSPTAASRSVTVPEGPTSVTVAPAPTAQTTPAKSEPTLRGASKILFIWFKKPEAMYLWQLASRMVSDDDSSADRKGIVLVNWVD